MAAHYPLPLGQPPDDLPAHAGPWQISPVDPTDFITLWPGEREPSLADVLAALQSQCRGEIEVIAEPAPEPDGAAREKMLWTAVLQLPETDGYPPMPAVVWAEPAQKMDEQTTSVLKAQHVRWSIGLETPLWPEDPVGHFMKILRLLGRGVADSPGILDVNKEGWHTRDELDSLLLNEENEIAESILFMVHAVGADSPPTPQSKMWIYSNGLHRAGLPELEMHEVPYAAVGSACALMTAIGELIVESGMPDIDVPLQLADDLAVQLRPWQEVAEHTDENMPGNPQHRQDHGGKELLGVRAAVCHVEPVGSFRKIWTWPSEVVQQLAMRGPTGIYKTKRSERRQAQLARASLEQLARAFVSLSPKALREGDDRQAVFLVEAGFQEPKRSQSSSGDDSREHLWFEVKRFLSPDKPNARVEAALVSQPNRLTHLRPGDIVKIDRNLVSNWQVLTRRGHFSPSNVEGLFSMIEQINADVS